MSKGARAMAVAMAHPDPEKGGRGKKAGKPSELFGGFSKDLLTMARTILRVTPTVAQSVIAGEKPLAAPDDEHQYSTSISANHQSRNDPTQSRIVPINFILLYFLLTIFGGRASFRGSERAGDPNAATSAPP